jgi:hypothetical protein
LLSNFAADFVETYKFNLKMSVPASEDGSPLTEAQKIAESMSSKDYFLVSEEKLINEWADKSVSLFKYR